MHLPLFPLPAAQSTPAWQIGLAASLMLAISTARSQTEVVAVVAVRPEPTRVAQTIQLNGTVTAERDAALSPRVSGLVSAVRVDAGDQVRKGQVLLELDPTLASLGLERARAALSEGQTQLGEAVRLRDEARRLAADGSIPQSQYQTREAEVRLAEAAVSRLDAARREQAELLARHQLPAPFAGLIREKLTDPGEWVDTGTPVLALVATDPVRIDVQVPQRHLNALTTQTRTQVRFDSGGESVRPGQIVARVPASDPATRTFLVRVGLDDGPAGAMPGQSARVEFELGRDTEALIIPRDAVKRYPDGTTTVWIVEPSGSTLGAREIPVTLQSGSGASATVIGGLDKRQRVVVRGNESLRPGQTVRLIDRP